MSATITYDCPRCAANSIKFQVLCTNQPKKVAGRVAGEVFAACPACKGSTIFKLTLQHNSSKSEQVLNNGFQSLEGNIDHFLEGKHPISKFDIVEPELPKNLPDCVKKPLLEAERCMRINCPNAAIAMYRACLDHVANDLNDGGANGAQEILPENDNPSLECVVRYLSSLDQEKIGLNDFPRSLKAQHSPSSEDAEEARTVGESVRDMLHNLYIGPGNMR